jgi:hypothetical protein
MPLMAAGVRWSPSQKAWLATIEDKKGPSQRLGYFSTEQEAAHGYREALEDMSRADSRSQSGSEKRASSMSSRDSRGDGKTARDNSRGEHGRSYTACLLSWCLVYDLMQSPHLVAQS